LVLLHRYYRCGRGSATLYGYYRCGRGSATLYGGVADAVGLSGSFLLVTVVVLLILPLLLCFDPPSKSTDNEGVRRTAYVRFWHKADVPTRSANVRFWG